MTGLKMSEKTANVNPPPPKETSNKGNKEGEKA